MHDLAKLQGEWMIASVEIDGAELDPSVYAKARLVVHDKRFISMSMGVVYEGALEIDSATNPKSLAMHFDAGLENGNVNRGIYELTAEGWRFCLSITGGPAPSEFATSPGSGHALQVLARS